MKIRIGLWPKTFDPDSLNWMHQASPLSQFGFWNTGGRTVFVKRSARRPTGWDLLVAAPAVPNLPRVLNTLHDGTHHYYFSEMLDGDIFWNVLAKSRVETFFGQQGLSPRARMSVFAGVYESIRALHKRGFWYPDLDFKNVFLARHSGVPRTWLIDVDSCAKLGEPYYPETVSQTYWEGLAKTYKKRGIPFLKRDNLNLPVLAPEGTHLNQSMLVLFAYDMQRVGLVTPNRSLFDPLVHEKNPHREKVVEIHDKLANGSDAWEDIDRLAAAWFNVPLNEFKDLARKHSTGTAALLAKLRRLFPG